MPIRGIGDQLCKRGVPIDLQNTNKEERDGLCAGARDWDVADREAPHGATNTTVTGSMGILTASLTEHHPHVRQRVELTRSSLSAATYAPAMAHVGGSGTSARLGALSFTQFMSVSVDFESVTLSVCSAPEISSPSSSRNTINIKSISPLASRLLQGVRSATRLQRWAVDLLTPLQPPHKPCRVVELARLTPALLHWPGSETCIRR